MTQENKIWHVYNIQDRPQSNREILVCNDFYNFKKVIARVQPIDWDNNFYAWVHRWAYVEDLIASSKALEVAITALEQLRDVPDDDNDNWFNYCCPRCVLQEIQEIMKS